MNSIAVLGTIIVMILWAMMVLLFPLEPFILLFSLLICVAIQYLFFWVGYTLEVKKK